MVVVAIHCRYHDLTLFRARLNNFDSADVGSVDVV